MTFRRSSHAVWECKYHIVWSTKYRKKALNTDVLQSYCKLVLRKISEQYDFKILNLEVDIDHVHLLIEISPQRSVGSAIGILKSLSARMMFDKHPILKKKLWAGSLWESSYFVRGVGEGVTSMMVEKYIAHHSEEAQSDAQAELFPVKGKSKAKR